MRLHILSAHAGGDIEPTLYASLLSLIPQVSIHAADAVIVVVSYHGDYRFNETLFKINKPVILVDMLEYFGFQSSNSSHLLGAQGIPNNLRGLREWHRLWDWAEEKPPALYFKRELRQQDQTDTVLPIEWPCGLPAWAIESEEAFNRRPFILMFNWGYSNSLRPRLAGQIYELMAQGKIEVISSFDHIDAKVNEPQPKWISIHSPHTHRTHINDVVRRQAQSKMAVSLPGSGVRCFRDTEMVHTVPVYAKTEMARSLPWHHGVNCLELDTQQNMAEQILQFSQIENLHTIYTLAQRDMDKMRPQRYMDEYILPIISQAL